MIDIKDKTKELSNYVCVGEEEFYRDFSYKYLFDCDKSEYVVVKYDNNPIPLISIGKYLAGNYIANVTFYGDNNYNNKGFQKQLVSILKTCDIFFRIDSPEYLNSKWTKKELKEAETNELQIVTMAADHLKIMMLNNESIEQYLKMNQ